MSSTKPPKAAIPSSDRTYASVEDLMKGEGVSAEVQQTYAQLVRDTCVTDGLTRLRRAAKLTQAEIAQRLGVTQAAVSKIESGRDETLTVAIIRAYAEASKRPIVIHFGPRVSHVEAVKQHAAGLRHHLDALAALAHKDEAMAKDIERFFQEASHGIDQVISCCRERLPRSPKVEVVMQTQVDLPAQRSRVTT
jgi:transcriptional regulator with XRE-family HTH domain